MPGQDAFSNPFSAAQRNGTSSSRNPPAIGTGRNRNHRSDEHSPTSQTNGSASPRSHAIRLRKLPPNSTQETVRTILLFAKDLIHVEMAPSPEADVPHCTAVAYFKTNEAAREAGAALHGKRPGQDKQELVVEQSSPSPSASPTGPHLQNGIENQPPKHNSRFSDTFREMDRLSPTQYSDMSRSYMEGSIADGISPTFRSVLPGNGVTFGTQSPAKNSRERQHVSGRSMIQEDGADDEPTQIMQDPGSFMSAERQRPFHEQGRRATAPNLHMLQRMGSLSINSNVGSPIVPNAMSPRNNGYGYQTPRNGAFSPQQNGFVPPQQNGFGMGMPSGQFTNTTSPVNPQYQPGRRGNTVMPPVNPSDQNPPCNTLYVGNLGPDTTEEDLKNVFSRVRGYRRLCFRMKHQGPMCFVEFEDVGLATRALRDYYGFQLPNSGNKGGIRLSFSKNPLGVRGNNQQSPISPNGNHIPGVGSGSYGGWPGGYGDMGSQPFSTANGPPPGLPPPQQRNNSVSHANGNGHMQTGSFGRLDGGYPFQANGRGYNA